MAAGCGPARRGKGPRSELGLVVRSRPGGVAAGCCPVQGAGLGALGAASVRPESCRCAGRVPFPQSPAGADGAGPVRGQGGREVR